MPTVINGLPAHVLLLHVVVVLIPLAALMLVAGVVSPAMRRRLGVLTPAVALVALVFVPITTNAGEWLQHRLEASGDNPAIDRHAQLGDTLLPFAAVLFLAAAAGWWLGRRADASSGAGDGADTGPVPATASSAGSGGASTMTRSRTAPAWVGLAVAVVGVIAAVAAVVQVYRIGDSGAQASWSYVQQLPAS